MSRSIAFMSACLILVPVFGLFSSCSKKTDDWRLTSASIESKSQTLAVTSQSLTALESDSELVLRSAGSPVTAVTVSSVCRSTAGDMTRAFRVSGRSRLLIRDFWPEELWSQLDDATLIQSRCDFDIVAEDAVGSTHAFELKNVGFANYVDDTPEDTKSLSLTPSVFSQKSLGALTFATELARAPKSDETASLHLACDAFESEQTLLSSDPVSALKALAERPSKNPAQIDPRLTKTTQACRLIRKTDDGSGLVHHVRSKLFNYRFPSPKLEVKYDFSFQNAESRNYRHLSIFHFQIQNVSAVKTAVALPTDWGRIKMNFVAYYRDPDLVTPNLKPHSFVVGSLLVDEPLYGTIEGGKRKLLRSDYDLYELEPNESLSVTVGLRTDHQCMDLNGLLGIEPDPSAMYYAGTKFGLSKAISIFQIADISHPSADMKTEISLIDRPELKENAEPVVFVSSAEYRAQTGLTTEPPELIRLGRVRHNGAFFDACYYAEDPSR